MMKPTMRNKYVPQFLGSLAGYLCISLVLVALQVLLADSPKAESTKGWFGLAYAMVFTALLTGVLLGLLLLRFRTSVRVGVRDLGLRLKLSSNSLRLNPLIRFAPHVLTGLAVIVAYAGIGFVINAFVGLLNQLVSEDPARYPWLVTLIRVFQDMLWSGLGIAILIHSIISVYRLMQDLRIIDASTGTLGSSSSDS